MVIYSFNHDSFGKTTNHPGAAGDNARYNADLSKTQMAEFLAANAMHLEEHGQHRSTDEISAHLEQFRQGRSAAENAAYNARREATYATRSHVIPLEPEKAQAWFDAQEKTDRKNARMSDRFIGALPRELTPEQCIEAVESFCHDVTQNKVPWHAALHLELEQRGQADWNPHVHIIIRDRDIETGRRYLYTSAHPKERARLAEKGIHAWTTKDFRIEWQNQMNRSLERAGHDIRVDHRTLKEQGIDREAQIHIGPGSQKAAEKGQQFTSRDHQVGERTIPYSLLDNGTRAGHNAQIQERNAARAIAGHSPSDARTAEAFKARIVERPARDPHEEELRRMREVQSEQRRAMLKEQRRDWDALRGAQMVQWNQHRAWTKQLYATARKDASRQVKEQTAGQWKAVEATKDQGQREMSDAMQRVRIKQLYAKASTQRIAEARVEKNAAWEAVRQQQAKERLSLREAHREEARALIREHTAQRLALVEQHRTASMLRDANRIVARVNGNQGMPNQQRAALETIRLKQQVHEAAARDAGKERAAQGRVNDPGALQQTAAAERHCRTTIRSRLDAQRQSNRMLSAAARPAAARESTADRTRTRQANQQSQVRQAIMAGVATSADRTSASPELREIIARRERRAAERAISRDRTAKRQDRGRGGRTGGGRDR
jgi:MobA/MobL family